jgi:hypothetical protein
MPAGAALDPALVECSSKFGHLRCGGCAVLAGRVPGPASVTAVDDLGQLGQRADAAAGVGLPENLVSPF